MKIFCLAWIIGLLWEIFHTLITSKLCYAFGSGCIDVPFVLSLAISLFVLYGIYIMFVECNISELFTTRKKSQVSAVKINVDYITVEDKEWIAEIKQRAKNKEKLIAYSKDGSNAAKKKAIELGLKDCFVDFKSKEEVKKERGW